MDSPSWREVAEQLQPQQRPLQIPSSKLQLLRRAEALGAASHGSDAGLRRAPLAAVPSSDSRPHALAGWRSRSGGWEILTISSQPLAGGEGRAHGPKGDGSSGAFRKGAPRKKRCSPLELRLKGETGSLPSSPVHEASGHLQSARGSQVWAHPLPPGAHFFAFLFCSASPLQVSQVTGDSSQGSGTEPISCSALAAWEARLALAATFTSLGDFQGNASMLI